MNETVAEWFEKAEGDYGTGKRELAVTDGPNYDAVCYHAQQCVEKMIKGVLVHHGVVPPKIHDRLHLAKLLQDAVPSWDWSKQDLRWLTRAGMAFRYPGGSARREHATKAFAVCTDVRERLRKLAGAEQ